MYVWVYFFKYTAYTNSFCFIWKVYICLLFSHLQEVSENIDTYLWWLSVCFKAPFCLVFEESETLYIVHVMY